MEESKAPLFIKIEEYADIVDVIGLIQNKISDIDKTLEKIRDIKSREDSELASWKSSLDYTKARIEEIDPTAMKRAINDGKIIVVASDAGRVGSLGETVYSAAKGGAIAFTKGLAREMARYNINVNSVCPGPTDTPLLDAVPEKFKEAFIRATPMRRLAKPQEVADAVLFFASDRASFITGQVLSVNGGLDITG